MGVFGKISLTENSLAGKMKLYICAVFGHRKGIVKKMKKRFICAILLLSLLCPLFASCASPALSLITRTEENAGEAVTKEEKETTISYPCQIDPDFRVKDPKYENLSAEALKALPVASENMTAMERRKLCLDYFQMQLTFRRQTNLDVTDYQTTPLTSPICTFTKSILPTEIPSARNTS